MADRVLPVYAIVLRYFTTPVQISMQAKQSVATPGSPENPGRPTIMREYNGFAEVVVVIAITTATYEAIPVHLGQASLGIHHLELDSAL
jgi:hypothetical protein